MTLDALIMLAGALVALLPFLGFPTAWDTVMFFALGVFTVALGIVVRRRGLGHLKRPQPTQYHESNPVDYPTDQHEGQ